MIMDKTFCNNLKEIRQGRGLSQLALAVEMQTTQKAIWDWEKGNKEPCLSNIKSLCKVLNVEPNDLLGND